VTLSAHSPKVIAIALAGYILAKDRKSGGTARGAEAAINLSGCGTGRLGGLAFIGTSGSPQPIIKTSKVILLGN
jgi:hypothetical protein